MAGRGEGGRRRREGGGGGGGGGTFWYVLILEYRCHGDACKFCLLRLCRKKEDESGFIFPWLTMVSMALRSAISSTKSQPSPDLSTPRFTPREVQESSSVSREEDMKV